VAGGVAQPFTSNFNHQTSHKTKKSAGANLRLERALVPYQNEIINMGEVQEFLINIGVVLTQMR
jgi:hypothetical protein